MSNEKNPLSLADAVALLDLLTSDEAFRATFQADPAAALAQVSPEAAAAAVECSMPGVLAPVEVLAEAREQLIEQFTKKAMFSLPHCFIDGSAAPAK